MIIRELRKSKGISQKEMAELLEISRSTYTRYESGLRNPDVNTLIKIAKIFKVSTDYILGIENNEPILEDIMMRYRNLSPINKDKVNEYVEMLYERDKLND